jgi:hypothetical protein
MNPTPPTTVGPVEKLLAATLIGASSLAGLVWGSGVVIGSILGASLPASVDGVVAMGRSWPAIGDAWTPAIPSWLVFAGAAAAFTALVPGGWWLYRAIRNDDRGAHWADHHRLRRSGLLVADRPLGNATEEHRED